ncbi:MAG: glycosyltransferase family 39 protein, partial [Rhodospirillaceae bacterium]
MAPRLRPYVLPTVLWGSVIAAALAVRPPLPVDETRYLAVAWDMWREGHFLVPHLNGDTYSHKPPLLFWLICAGWKLFGVGDWWPRMVAPLFGLGCLFLTRRLAAVLWPDRPRAFDTAPVLLFGCVFWAVFTTLTMFDMILAFFALAALIALVMAARTGRWRGFVAAGLAVGLGVLAKGPAVLLHILPVALAAPWWLPRLAGRDPDAAWTWGRWYAGVLLTVGIGAAVGLAWALPAATAGGPAYRAAIFWGQSAGRMVDSFAHAK